MMNNIYLCPLTSSLSSLITGQFELPVKITQYPLLIVNNAYLSSSQIAVFDYSKKMRDANYATSFLNDCDQLVTQFHCRSFSDVVDFFASCVIAYRIALNERIHKQSQILDDMEKKLIDSFVIEQNKSFFITSSQNDAITFLHSYIQPIVFSISPKMPLLLDAVKDIVINAIGSIVVRNGYDAISNVPTYKDWLLVYHLDAPIEKVNIVTLKSSEICSD